MIATAADGTRLHYIVEGTGPPLVLVGGRTSTIEGAWWRYIPALSARFTVIALDNRGTGGSREAHTPHNTPLMAEGAPTPLPHARGNPAPLVGPSIGGGSLPQPPPPPPPARSTFVL